MSDLIVNRWEDGARMPDLTFRAVVFGDDRAAVLAESDSADALAAWAVGYANESGLSVQIIDEDGDRQQHISAGECDEHAAWLMTEAVVWAALAQADADEMDARLYRHIAAGLVAAADGEGMGLGSDLGRAIRACQERAAANYLARTRRSLASWLTVWEWPAAGERRANGARS